MALFKRSAATPDPERVAIDALGFIAEDPERLGAFLALTGVDPSSIRDALREPGFLAAVLDHILTDDALVVAFAADKGMRPEAVAVARHALAGAPPQ